MAALACFTPSVKHWNRTVVSFFHVNAVIYHQLIIVPGLVVVNLKLNIEFKVSGKNNSKKMGEQQARHGEEATKNLVGVLYHHQDYYTHLSQT